MCTRPVSLLMLLMLGRGVVVDDGVGGGVVDVVDVDDVVEDGGNVVVDVEVVVDVDDVVWFDYEDYFVKHPLIFKLTQFLEWFYIPAHEFIMHILMMFGSFIIPERKSQRPRNITVIVGRFSLFICLLVWFPRVALFYVFSYITSIAESSNFV